MATVTIKIKRQNPEQAGKDKPYWQEFTLKDVDPTDRLLELLHRVTTVTGMRSMAMDLFELPDGRLLINELQTVFGASVAVHQLKCDGEPGRMVRVEAGRWRFEAGDFARNACANLRLLDALKLLAEDRGRTSASPAAIPQKCLP